MTQKFLVLAIHLAVLAVSAHAYSAEPASPAGLSCVLSRSVDGKFFHDELKFKLKESAPATQDAPATEKWIATQRFGGYQFTVTLFFKKSTDGINWIELKHVVTDGSGKQLNRFSSVAKPDFTFFFGGSLEKHFDYDISCVM